MSLAQDTAEPLDVDTPQSARDKMIVLNDSEQMIMPETGEASLYDFAQRFQLAPKILAMDVLDTLKEYMEIFGYCSQLKDGEADDFETS